MTACRDSAPASGVHAQRQITAAQGQAKSSQRQLRDAANQNRLANSATTEVRRTGVTARDFNTTAPYENQVGWLVRGSDFLLFLPCGKREDYYIVAAPAVEARIRQFYRFAATRPFLPVFVEMSSRLVQDTLTVRRTRFDHIVEVKEFRPDRIGAPKCTRPPMSAVIEHVRKYEPI